MNSSVAVRVSALRAVIKRLCPVWFDVPRNPVRISPTRVSGRMDKKMHPSCPSRGCIDMTTTSIRFNFAKKSTPSPVLLNPNGLSRVSRMKHKILTIGAVRRRPISSPVGSTRWPMRCNNPTTQKIRSPSNPHRTQIKTSMARPSMGWTMIYSLPCWGGPPPRRSWSDCCSGNVIDEAKKQYLNQVHVVPLRPCRSIR